MRVGKTESNGYKIRTKLLWMLLPLLLSMLLLGIFTFNEKYEHYRMSLSSSEIIVIASNMSNFVHALQMERGVSAGYRASNGLKYTKELESKRENTDDKLRTLIQAITEHNCGINFRREIAVQSRAKWLKQIRNKVDITGRNDIFDDYSNLVARVLQSINSLTYNVADKTLAREQNAYLILLWMQESAAKERGLLNRVFEAEELDVKTYIRISEYTNKFDQLLYNFNAMAPQQYKDALQKKLEHPVVHDVDRFRVSAMDKVYRNYFINELRAFLGYRGMIHHFKNYIIRGDERMITMFEKDYHRALYLMAEYRGLGHCSETDKKNIRIIERTIQDYADMLRVAQAMKKEGKGVGEIDSIIKIDDQPAVNAFRYLRENVSNMDVGRWWEQSTMRIDFIKQVSDDMQSAMLLASTDKKGRTLKVLVLFVLGLLFVTSMSFVLGIVIMRRVVRDLIDMTDTMNKMRSSGDYSHTFFIEGADELSDMQRAFNQLIADRNEAELNQRLASEVFDSVCEGIVVLNSDLKIEMVNPAFTTITGYSFEEVKGGTSSFLRSDIQKQKFYYAMWEELLEHDFWEGEIWNRRKNGESYPALVSIHILRDESQNISKYIGMFRDITARKANEEKILYQANYDALTGLANRNRGMAELQRELKVAKRNESMLALMFIDLDGFKSVNDTLGHERGDRLLKEVSRRFQESVREVDTIARIGGDEFIVILPGINGEEDVQRVASTILKEVSRPLVLKEGEAPLVSVSIGIALYPNDAEDTDWLIRCADEAMYRVKQSGKNNYFLFSWDTKELLI